LRVLSYLPISNGHHIVTYPRVVNTTHTRVSPYVTLVEKAVQFAPGEPPQVYHCLTQADYVGVLALTQEGLIPMVRQFRPTVEQFTWELPAGTLEPGETPEDAAHRELREEAGLHIDELVSLGCFIPDTGRLQIHSHAFFARASHRGPVRHEQGLTVRFVAPKELKEMIRRMEFRHQLHLAIYAAALVHDVARDLRL
jgi:ADP-ribose pyrophosphatase